MSRVREDAGKFQVRRVRYLSRDVDRFGRVRLDAAAMIAAIDLDEYVELHTRIARRPIKRGDRIGVISQQIELCSTAKDLDRLAEFPLLDRHRIRNIRKPVLCKRPLRPMLKQ